MKLALLSYFQVVLSSILLKCAPYNTKLFISANILNVHPTKLFGANI